MPSAGSPLTVFGATILELMARRGITKWTQLYYGAPALQITNRTFSSI